MEVGITGPPGAKVMIIGEAPGEQEERTGHPFVGRNGDLLSRMLIQSDITRQSCLLGNVVRRRPPGGDIKYYFENAAKTVPTNLLKTELDVLASDIRKYKPNIIIALGRTALWALTGQTKISECRGYIYNSTLVPGVKVLPTYHPGAINDSWEMLFPAIMDIRKAVNNSKVPDILSDTRILRSSPSRGEFIEYLDYCRTRDIVAVDIETVSPGSHIDIFGIGVSSDDAMAFTFLRGRKPTQNDIRAELDLWLRIADVMNNTTSVMHNGMYDATVLMHNNGIACRGYTEDTMVMTHCCWPETPRSLSFLSSICLNVPAWKHLQMDMPAWYNANDVANTFGCYEVMKKEVTEGGYYNTYREEMSQVEITDYLQLRGIKVSKARQQQLIKESKENAEKAYAELVKVIGRPINLNSPKQVAQLLYGDLGLPPQYQRRKSTKDKRTVTTDRKALSRLLLATKNPVLQMIMDYKKADKLIQFVDIELSPEGRVHTSYNITGATMSRQTTKAVVVDDDDHYQSFGRWSSSKSIILPYGSGNLQNIPGEARKMYVPDGEGTVFVQADYKQAEAVAVSYIINDNNLKRMFQQSYGQSAEYCAENGLDVHKLTASLLFNVPVQEVTKEQRKVGKLVRHANSYSAGPKVIADQLGITLREAKKFQENYHNRIPQLKLWYKEVQRELGESRTLVNLLGRKHKFLKRWGDELFRSAYSFVPQSTVGDMLNKALVKYYKEFNDVAPIALQLHDAQYVIAQGTGKAVLETMYNLYSCMAIPITYKGETFCIDVDFKVGYNWGEMVDIELRQSEEEIDEILQHLKERQD